MGDYSFDPSGRTLISTITVTDRGILADVW